MRTPDTETSTAECAHVHTPTCPDTPSASLEGPGSTPSPEHWAHQRPRHGPSDPSPSQGTRLPWRAADSRPGEKGWAHGVHARKDKMPQKQGHGKRIQGVGIKKEKKKNQNGDVNGKIYVHCTVFPIPPFEFFYYKMLEIKGSTPETNVTL